MLGLLLAIMCLSLAAHIGLWGLSDTKLAAQSTHY